MKLYKASELIKLKSPLTFSKIVNGKMHGLYVLGITYEDGTWEYLDLVPPLDMSEIDTIHYANSRLFQSSVDFDAEYVVVWDSHSLGCLEPSIIVSQGVIKRSGVDY